MMKMLRRLIKSMLPESVLRRIELGRAARALFETYYGSNVRAIRSTVLATGETHNFTYDLGERNLRYLAETVAIATGLNPAETEAFIREGMNDAALRAHVLADYKMPPRNLVSPFGRRLGWYAMARVPRRAAPRTSHALFYPTTDRRTMDAYSTIGVV